MQLPCLLIDPSFPESWGGSCHKVRPCALGPDLPCQLVPSHLLLFDHLYCSDCFLRPHHRHFVCRSSITSSIITTTYHFGCETSAVTAHCSPPYPYCKPRPITHESDTHIWLWCTSIMFGLEQRGARRSLPGQSFHIWLRCQDAMPFPSTRESSCSTQG